ncbi:MAG: aldehyde dehydrogenase family protein, partial [Pseudomonadota bacterium]
TPVTLELGGKSPVVIGSGADLAQAAERIVLGKMMNAGQTCVAPDYVLVRREDRDAFITALRDFTEASWPAVANDPDSTQLISPRAAARLDALVNEARVAGTRVLELQHRGADRRMPLTLVIEPERDQRLLRRELFGPVLPILTWSTIDEAIEHIQSGDHPLGLYHFGSDPRERRELLDRTLSGGVTLDDVFFHVTVEDLPLGGIGASGMGAYHGREGFLTFSHARAIYRQSRLPVARLAGMIPPYGKRLERLLRSELGGR